MEIDATRMVKDIVLAEPVYAKVFEQIGIDYCCGGNRPLADACRTAGVNLEDVTQLLKARKSSAAIEDEVTDWNKQSLTVLMNHIVQKHHTFCRTEIARLKALLDKVTHVHGDVHSELRRIQALFTELSRELLVHLLKEEQILFPQIASMEDAATHRMPSPQATLRPVQSPVQKLVLDHDSAGAALHEIRSLSCNYQVPADACGSYRALYEALQSFEADLHQHVHLENNILFPRAVVLEQSVVSSGKECLN